jgi:CDP-glycerol glycerophosphotransferase
MSTAFYPVDPKNVIVTGLARNDFILTDEHKLPNYCKEQLNSLRKLVGGKKLIIYAPTYREINLGGRNYEFSENEILQLKELLLKHNAILGLRLHYYNRNLSYENMIDNIFFFDLDQTLLPDMAMIIREATLVITDYSALFVDTLYSGKDVISFAYDYDSYGSKQRGFTYPLEAISPFPVCKIFDDLIENMNRSLNGDTKEFRSKYSLAKKFFFKYNDANNSKRVVEHIKQHLLKH